MSLKKIEGWYEGHERYMVGMLEEICKTCQNEMSKIAEVHLDLKIYANLIKFCS